MALIIVGIIAGVLLLWITHRVAYLRGFRKADRIYYERYYKPMFDRDAKVLATMSAILREDQSNLSQRCTQLYFETRRLKKKAILLACRYGAAARKIKNRQREMSTWMSYTEHFVQTLKFLR